METEQKLTFTKYYMEIIFILENNKQKNFSCVNDVCAALGHKKIKGFLLSSEDFSKRVRWPHLFVLWYTYNNKTLY